MTRSVYRRTARSASGIFVCALLCGCMPMEVRSTYGPGVNYERFGSTFAWSTPSDRASAEKRARNPSFDQYLQATITRAFQERGYTLHPEPGPDFLIDYAVARRITGGLGSSQLSPVYEEGSLIIDVLDGRTGKYVWRGWATARINEAADPTTQKRNTAEAVRRILARFPAQGTQ
ncbi:MAG: DUF4136 domain-containing protein [Planctomycetota bacterium]